MMIKTNINTWSQSIPVDIYKMHPQRIQTYYVIEIPELHQEVKLDQPAVPYYSQHNYSITYEENAALDVRNMRVDWLNTRIYDPNRTVSARRFDNDDTMIVVDTSNDSNFESLSVFSWT